MVLSATFETVQGSKLAGYLAGSEAFGVFFESGEFAFNRSLPEAGALTARRLGEALEEEWRDLFPLRYRSMFRGADGLAIEGAFAAFWG